MVDTGIPVNLYTASDIKRGLEGLTLPAPFPIDVPTGACI